MNQVPAFIELVDTEILASAAIGQTIRAPGYAVLEEQGIDTGDTAFSRAWLYPQRSFNQFWRQLTLAPLPVPHKHARHYADLAFAQLKALYQALDNPEEVVFLLPGSFSRDQLSILLGLANALPVKTVAIVDTAVAAASMGANRGDVLHIDLQLHQAVITHLHVDDKAVRMSVETVPDAGLTSFYRSWAQWIADQFIAQYRYDPLHLAENEQQLYNLLPSWLLAIEAHGQTTAELATEKGNFRVNLARSTLSSLSNPKAQRLLEALDRFPKSAQRVGTYRLNRLPGLASLLNLSLLDEQQAISGSRAALTLFDNQQGNVPYVTELPVQGTATSERNDSISTKSRPLASHLLYRHQALAIGEGLGIVMANDKLTLNRNPQADLWLAFAGDTLSLHTHIPVTLSVEGDPENLKPGDSLILNGETLDLIEVKAVP